MRSSSDRPGSGSLMMSIGALSPLGLNNPEFQHRLALLAQFRQRFGDLPAREYAMLDALDDARDAGLGPRRKRENQAGIDAVFAVGAATHRIVLAGRRVMRQVIDAADRGIGGRRCR